VWVSRTGTDRRIGRMSDTAQTLVTSAGKVSDAVPSDESDTVSHILKVSGTTQALTGQSRPTTDTAAITPASCGAGPDRMSDSPGAVPDRVTDTADACPRAFADLSATLTSDRKRLSDAVDIVRTHGHLSGSDMAKQMGRCGHPMSSAPACGGGTAPRNTDSSARLWSLHVEHLVVCLVID
jgi:hypothetical protein